MAHTARKLIVEVVGDSKSYERALNRSATATNQFGQAMGTTSPRLGKLSTGMAAAGTSSLFLAGAAGGLAVALGTKSVQAASDLNEQLSRTQVVLGDAADATIKWSETTATSMGISQRAALAAAGTFAGLFQTVGVNVNQAAELSRSLVQLAADLASLQNSSPEEALIALRSGLAGEAEPLRRFNIFLTEARVQQQALADTGKATTSALTQQEKTLARYNLILKDSVLAQGNFELTSGGLANQQRILAAQVDDLSTKLGSALVPAVVAVVGALNDAITAGEDLAVVLQTLASLPVIEIPIKLVGDVAEGRGAGFLRHIILGQVSPLALGITIGKEIVDGIRQGSEGALGTGALPGPGETAVSAGEESRGRAQTRERVAAGNAVIAQITRQAANQGNLNRQLADSETRAAHLRDLIRADPDNAKLQKRLTDELTKQARLREDIASAAEAAARATEDEAKAARDVLVATLDLRAAQAGLTKSLQDDLVVAKQREATLKRLVALNRDDLDLAQQLVGATQARRDIEVEIAENRRDAKNRAAFKALGLTPEGLTPTPSAGALLKRGRGIQDLIKGTVFDTKKTRTQLRKIINFLKTHLKGASREVRQAILGMLNDLKVPDSATGPLTKGSGLKVGKILEGMGLSPEEVRELRARLSHVSSGGKVLARQGAGTRATGGVGFGDNPPIIVESHVYIDGREVTTTVTKQQQRDKRRNPRQKRGPNRIGGV